MYIYARIIKKKHTQLRGEWGPKVYLSVKMGKAKSCAGEILRVINFLALPRMLQRKLAGGCFLGWRDIYI